MAVIKLIKDRLTAIDKEYTVGAFPHLGKELDTVKVYN